MRNGLVVGVVVAAVQVLALAWVGGVAAQDGAKEAELGEGRSLGGLLSSAEVRLDERESRGDGWEAWVAENAGAGGRSSTVADADSGENDELVPVMLATFGVAVAAMIVGLVAYLLRVRVGLVQSPPPAEERHDSH